MIALVNSLTLIRILIGIIIFGLLILHNHYLVSFILFFIAGLTDYLDGKLARKYNAYSQIGEILDPIADKILIVFLLFGLALNLSSFLIAFLGSLIIAREIWVSALRDYNSRNNNHSATKIKTTIQLFTISIYLLGLASGNMLFIVFGDLFLIISTLITIYTGFLYTFSTFKK